MAQPETDRQPLRMYVVTAGHGLLEKTKAQRANLVASFVSGA